MPRAPQRRVFLVGNAGDESGTGAYLTALGGPDQHRAVVRPTPGEHDPAVLGADVLVALGKNPEVLRTEQLGAEVWNLARAWAIGLDVQDLVVDRVHLLTPEQIVALIQLAARQATLWLVHGGTTTDDTAEYLDFLGHPVQRMLWTMLPTALRPASVPQLFADPVWPVLPAADFTTFLAACHRYLPRGDFDRVAAVHELAGQRADYWAGAHRGSGPDQLTAAVTRWLRDEQLAGVRTAAEALITLRATQAALSVRGMLLRWNTTNLGPDPARRLLGDLTPGRAAALSTFARTDHAAAAGLSLHLNLGPVGFGCWRWGDVSLDGATIQAPREHGPHPGRRPPSAELPCDGPITVPAHSRPILAAHLAYRRSAGARDRHPLFVHTTDPAQPVHHGLRTAIQRINERINLNPPWVHRSPCRWGADVGQNPRSPGWLTERGLSIHLVDAPFYLQLPAARTRPTNPARRRAVPPAATRSATSRPGQPTNYQLFLQRQQHSHLSLWELGDLLGIHPHHLHTHDNSGALADQPVRTLIELARHLDMHPADLVPALQPLLGNARGPARYPEPAAHTAGHGAATEPDTDTDARTILAALATTSSPLTVDELATALGWTLDRATAALDHVYAAPELAGPYALRRVPPNRFALASRLDRLTDQQRTNLADIANYHDPLTLAQAQALLAAINLGGSRDYETWREDHLAAEQQLKDRGLIRTHNGPHRVQVHPDVLVSLRYHGIDD